MRIDEVFVDNFKNLNKVNINFDESNLSTVLIGQNATGKSNLLEALVLIFRNLDLDERIKFKFNISYQCRGRSIVIENDPNKQKTPKINVDGKAINYSTFIQNRRQYLPNNIFTYYSGNNERLEIYFDKHQDSFYRNLLQGKIAPLRPLFYAKKMHSQYVLLSFFSFEDKKALKFLEEYFDIEKFVNATLILKRPKWFKSKYESDLFWGAKGVVRDFLDYLHSIALPGIKHEEILNIGQGESTKEELLRIHIPDLNSLRKIASKYGRNIEFFNLLESTYLSDLVFSLEIRVKKKGVSDPISFSELSEGEQQLLTVLGLLRFTNQEESLFLLDEPDTHLNSIWKLYYMDLLRNIVGENQTSHVLIVTHDPLLVGGLKKEQVLIFGLNGSEKQVFVSPPQTDPIGLGVSGLLTTLFDLPTTLDLETQRKLDRKRFLVTKDDLDVFELEELKNLDEELSKMGFLSAFRDPLYSKFLEAIKNIELFNKPILSTEERHQQQILTRKIVEKLMEEKQ